MPRTLSAALTTAMDSGAYNPYLKIILIDAGDVEYTVDPLYFKLEDTSAVVHVAPFTTEEIAFFRIERGAIVNGVAETITSSRFTIISRTTAATHEILNGNLVSKSYATVIPDSTYDFVLKQMLSNTITYLGASAWKNYQFYPTGKTIVFSTKDRIYNIIKQKFLLFAVNNGYSGGANDILVFCATDTRTKDYDIEDPLLEANNEQRLRRLLSRDENNTIETNGASNAPIHNLGFIRVADAQPTNTQNNTCGTRAKKIRVHLKYQTGDKVIFTRNGVAITGEVRIKVTETLDLNTEPAWFQTVEVLEWFTSTEGGVMPSTIEANAPYTPLVTGSFDGILSESDNNIQAAMETIDDHEHAGSGSIPIVTEDPVSPDDGELWLLRETLGAIADGNIMGMLAMTYTGNTGTTSPLQLSVNDDGTTRRIPFS